MSTACSEWQQQMDEENKTDANARIASEAACDAVSQTTALQRAVVARRTLAAMFDEGLVDPCADYFYDLMRNVAEAVGAPYVELYLAFRAPMAEPEVTRHDLAEWVAWCREHAPERLQAAAKGDA